MKERKMDEKEGEEQIKKEMEENKEGKQRKGGEEVEGRRDKSKQLYKNQIYGNMKLPRIEQVNEDKSNMGNHYKDT